MSEETEALFRALDQAAARIAALESMVLLLASMEAQRNPMMVAMLKRTAAGDGPNLVPDSPIPPNVTGDEREEMERIRAEHRKASKQALSGLSNMIAEFIERANRKPGS